MLNRIRIRFHILAFTFLVRLLTESHFKDLAQQAEDQLTQNMPISKLHKSFVFPASGASGAVTATILLDIFLHPTARLYFIIPVPAMLLGMFLLGQDFLRVNSGYMFISGSTHLGGATVAAIVWSGQRLRKRRR
ncbi:hypothetical protein ACLB2K_044411 [Fragaria x ananassa]